MTCCGMFMARGPGVFVQLSLCLFGIEHSASITECSLHFSLVVVQAMPSVRLQPLCMPDLKKENAICFLHIKGSVTQSLRSPSPAFILSCQHQYMSARNTPLLPSHPISSQPMGSQSPRHLERASQQRTHCSPYARHRAASSWSQLN